MFTARLAEVAGAVQATLDDMLAPLAPGALGQAMRYGVSGGKRLRAFLVVEGARLHGVPEAGALRAAAAVECIHAYSLIHDDLPAMDDDDLRRGRPTVHVKWDEATAVLAGDALQTLAFAILADPATAPEAERRLALISTLAEAAGAGGMVLGQARDIAAESAARPLTLDEITTLQAGKTGALIGWAAAAGPRLVGQDAGAMLRYAEALGLAFQIADDILDVEGDSELTGKRVGKDAAAGKATFVSLLGVDGAKARARALADEACAALESYGDAARSLRAAARFVISRQT